MTTIAFRTDDVIAVYAFTYFSHRQVGAMLRIANHITGRSLTSGEFCDLHQQIAQAIERQHPFIADLDIPQPGKDTYNTFTINAWMSVTTDRYGDYLDIAQEPLP